MAGSLELELSCVGISGGKLISISADRLIDRKDGLRDDECRRALKSTCLLVRACLKRTVREGPKTNALWHEFIHPHHVSPPVLLVVIRMNSYIRIILSFSYATVLLQQQSGKKNNE